MHVVLLTVRGCGPFTTTHALLLTHFDTSLHCDVMLQASLERCRAYLATVKALPYSLPKDVETLVCDELAAARTSDRSLTVEDLYRWMTTARLLTLSHGETQLSMPRWLQAQELDTLRIATLALAAESKFGACGDTSTRVITS